MDTPSKNITVNISGMHCAACEVLIERKLSKIDGVQHVKANLPKGQAGLIVNRDVRQHELNNAIKQDGYSVAGMELEPSDSNSTRDYFQIGSIFLIVVALFLVLQQMHVIPANFGVTSNMGYGLVFVIGLVAAVSTCMAVTGGLLLAVTAKYNDAHPELSGAQRFKPHVYFIAGRVVSYTILGGAVGAVGSIFSLSSRLNGVLTVIVSIVMVILGLQLLKVFPWLTRFQPKMPKFIAHRIYSAAEGRQGKVAPFLFGAATFFMPCGFTQALQLYVLSKGNFVTGALTMLVFALGTLPALMSVSAIMSFTKGMFQRYFIRFAGVIVVLVGVFNISNGLALAGIDFSKSKTSILSNKIDTQVVSDPNVQIVNGVQVVKMKVVGYTYQPSNFTVVAGVPVEWQIDGSQAAGCAQSIVMPNQGINDLLPKDGVKTIRFTPTSSGTLNFSCPMGMTTRGAAFTVVTGTQPSSTCDPSIADCVK